RALIGDAHRFEVLGRGIVFGAGRARATGGTTHARLLRDVRDVSGVDGYELIVLDGLARRAAAERGQCAVAVALASAPLGSTSGARRQAGVSGRKAVGVAAAATVHERLAQ